MPCGTWFGIVREKNVSLMKPMTRILLILMVIIGALIAKSALGVDTSQVVKGDKKEMQNIKK